MFREILIRIFFLCRIYVFVITANLREYIRIVFDLGTANLRGSVLLYVVCE